MIGKVFKTKDGKAGSFFGVNRYIISGEEKIELTGCLNTLVDDPKLCAVEMTSVAAQSRATKPVLHTLLSWQADEHPTSEQCEEAAQIVLHELGLDGHECVYALHKNTDNYHLHFSINKVDPDTFRSIDPNKGYTEKAMERAARWVEYRQQWKVEENTWSIITADGELIKNPNYKQQKEDKRIDQKVVDKENRYAEKSAVRIGQEQVKELIINAESWDELHQSLAAVDCRYERKGSGAIVFIGDTPVKASSIAKACGLNKLEKKLGAFVDPPEMPAMQKPERRHKAELLTDFAEAAVKQPEKLTNWQQYRIDKDEYYKARKADREELKEEYNKKYRELKAVQKAERQELAARGWKGRGEEYNTERSMLAAVHAGEMSELAEERKRARRELSEKYGQRFPSYEDWNKFCDRNKEAHEWRYRRPRVNEISHEDNIFVKPVPQDIRAFRAEADKVTGYVNYINTDTQRTAFIDRGKSIRVEKTDDATILAGLQLAQQKWGRVKLSGTPEYIAKCVEIAAKNGIKISNPELQEQYEAARIAAKQEEYNQTSGTPDRISQTVTNAVPAVVADTGKTRTHDTVNAPMHDEAREEEPRDEMAEMDAFFDSKVREFKQHGVLCIPPKKGKQQYFGNVILNNSTGSLLQAWEDENGDVQGILLHDATALDEAGKKNALCADNPVIINYNNGKATVDEITQQRPSVAKQPIQKSKDDDFGR